MGWLPEELRPDKSGIVFYPVAAHLTDAGIAHIAGQEVWAGALESKLGQEAFDFLARKMLTVVRLFGTQIFRASGKDLNLWKQRVGLSD
jgi:hypothetical protein